MADNQLMFRQANERLLELVVGAGKTDHRHIPFFCECANADCMGRVAATLDEFNDAHVTGDHYFMLVGHTRLESEEAIEENGRYEVLIKG